MGDVEIKDIPLDVSTATKDEINQLITTKNVEIARLTAKCSDLKKEKEEERNERWDAIRQKQAMQERINAVAEMLKVMSAGLKTD